VPKIRAAVAGANGYAGMTAVSLLAAHPDVELVQLTSRSLAGKPYQEVFPLLEVRGRFSDEIEPNGVDVIFSCLPHAAGAARTAQWFQAGARVIDMSADYRLKDAAAYPRWYGQEHPAPELLEKAVLGLPELHTEEIKQAQLIAVPGCYSTASILALEHGVVPATLNYEEPDPACPLAVLQRPRPVARNHVDGGQDEVYVVDAYAASSGS